MLILVSSATEEVQLNSERVGMRTARTMLDVGSTKKACKSMTYRIECDPLAISSAHQVSSQPLQLGETEIPTWPLGAALIFCLGTSDKWRELSAVRGLEYLWLKTR